jgi:nucleoside-diphosphate-sugar epimerase
MSRATFGQIKAIHAIARTRGWDEDAYLGVLSGYHVTTSQDLSKADASEFIAKHGDPAKIKFSRHRYVGKGIADGRAGRLTQEQADEIASLEAALDWRPETTVKIIRRMTGKNASPEMLMKHEAVKVILCMKGILDWRKRHE